MMGEQHKLLHCTVPIQEKLAAQEKKKQTFLDKIGGIIKVIHSVILVLLEAVKIMSVRFDYNHNGLTVMKHSVPSAVS